MEVNTYLFLKHWVYHDVENMSKNIDLCHKLAWIINNDNDIIEKEERAQELLTASGKQHKIAPNQCWYFNGKK